MIDELVLLERYEVLLKFLLSEAVLFANLLSFELFKLPNPMTFVNSVGMSDRYREGRVGSDPPLNPRRKAL